MPECYWVEHADFRACILKQGAQLIHFEPKNGKSYFWSADIATFQAEKPFRGGIPICWPWFAKQGTPSHGFARTECWNLIQQSETAHEVHLRFSLQDNPKTRTIWPHEFTLTLEMKLTKKEISLTLFVETDTPTTGALHSYFFVDDITHVSVKGLGNAYYESLDASEEKNAQEVEYITQETDRIYTKPEQQSILLYDEKPWMTLEHDNQSDVVLWNPWKEASSRLNDMQQDDYLHMLCVETARIFVPLNQQDRIGCCFKCV